MISRLAVTAVWCLGAAALAQTDNVIDDVQGLRAGASALTGVQLPFPAGAFGGELRAGVQATREFSLYGAVGGHVTVGPGQPERPPAFSGHVTASLLGEVFVGDLVYVAGGPGVAWGQLSVPQTDLYGELNTSISARGIKPFVDLRAGVTIHLDGMRAHSGLSIGLNGLLMFHPDATVLHPDVLGPAGSPNPRMVVTFTPGVTVGIDLR